MKSFLNLPSKNNFYVKQILSFAAGGIAHSEDWKVEFLNRISPEIESKIVELWFQGDSRDQIARVLMVGEGTVTEKISSLPSCLQLLRDLSRILRKLNLPVNASLEGAKVVQLLMELGVTTEQIPIFLEAIKKLSGEKGYRLEDVLRSSARLVELEHRSNKKYSVALDEFETLTEQTPRLRRENSQLQLEIQENIRKRDETLKKARTAPKELSEFLDCKAAFHEYGMKIRDAKTIRKMLDNFREAGGNVKRLISLIKRHGSIGKLVALFERQLPEAQDKHANLLSQIAENRQIILQQQEEQKQRESIINSQEWTINSNNCLITRQSAFITKLERRKGEFIAWLGKRLNLPREKIVELRCNTEVEILLAYFDSLQNDTLISLRDKAARYFLG